MSQTTDLIQYIFLVGAFLVTLCSQSLLLVKCLKAKANERMSSSILMNMFFWIIASISGAIYMSYRGFVNPNEWNVVLMFLIICFYGFNNSAISASVTFVLLDRIFVLKRPIHYKRWQQCFIIFGFSCCVFAGVLTVAILCITELPLNTMSGCTSFGCALSRHKGDYAMSVRALIGVVNIIFACIFQWVLCNFTAVTAFKRQFTKANRLTLIAFCTEFFCNLFPNTLHFACELLGVDELSTLGPYQIVAYSLDALVTAFIYRFILTSKRYAKSKIAPNQLTLHSISKPTSLPIRID